MLEDAWSNAEQDLKTRQIIDLHAQKQNILDAIYKHIDFAKETMVKQDWETLEHAIKDSESLKGSSDSAKIRQANETLEKSSVILAELLMNQVAKESIKNKKISDLSS